MDCDGLLEKWPAPLLREAKSARKMKQGKKKFTCQCLYQCTSLVSSAIAIFIVGQSDGLAASTGRGMYRIARLSDAKVYKIY